MKLFCHYMRWPQGQQSVSKDCSTLVVLVSSTDAQQAVSCTAPVLAHICLVHINNQQMVSENEQFPGKISQHFSFQNPLESEWNTCWPPWQFYYNEIWTTGSKYYWLHTLFPSHLHMCDHIESKHARKIKLKNIHFMTNRMWVTAHFFVGRQS